MFQRRRSMNAIDLFAKNASPKKTFKQQIKDTNKMQVKKSPDKKPQHKRC